MLQDCNIVKNDQTADNSMMTLLLRIEQRLSTLERDLSGIHSLVSASQIEKEWYTTSEVADILGKKQYTVQEKWCNQGRIECEKDPDTGKWRIPGKEVQRLRAGGALQSSR